MRTVFMIAAPALLLASCGGEAEQGNNTAEPAVPTAFPVGEWEVTTTVENVAPTDGSTPATSAKVGDTSTRKACIADSDGLIAVFTPEGSDCSAITDYARQGRINTAYKCNARGGFISPMANGRYTADSFDVQLDTSSQFSGSGDYQMSAKATGRRVGDCPAAASEAG